MELEFANAKWTGYHIGFYFSGDRNSYHVNQSNDFSDPNPYQPGKAVPPKAMSAGEATGDATGGVIPYKNPHALISYYTGIFSCVVPVVGLIGGIVAIVLGMMGIVKRQQNPVIRGTVHAIVGIIFGCIAVVINGLCTMGIIGAMFGGM